MGTQPLPFEDVQNLAVRLGTNSEIIQGRSGTVSAKKAGLMWVRADAASLAIADQSDIFIPLRIDQVLRGIQTNRDNPTELATLEADMGLEIDQIVQPLSISALDALFPHRIVAQVTPPNIIALSTLNNGLETIRQRLDGLRFAIAPFAPPGAPLNKVIARTLGELPEMPDILIVARWNVVVAGNTCNEIEARLKNVMDRLQIPSRSFPQPNIASLAQRLEHEQEWRLPEHQEIHAMGCDPISLEICRKGLLTGWQAMSLGLKMPLMEPSEKFWQAGLRHEKGYQERPGYLVVPDEGVVVAADLTPHTESLLAGFSRTLQYLPNSTSHQTLTTDETENFIKWRRDSLQGEVEDRVSPCLSTKV